MSEGTRPAVPYAIATLIGCVIVLVVGAIGGLFRQPDTAMRYAILCDGFFTAAVLLAGIGLMIMLSNWGTFDILNYGIRSFGGLFSQDAKDRKPDGSFYEYKQKKAARQAPFWFLVIVGAAFFVGALVLYALYRGAVV